jgi:predicted RNA-binding Zn ribbon-like protein
MMQHIPLEKFDLDKFLDQIKRQRKMIPDDSVREIVEYLKRTITGIATTPAGFSIDADITDAKMILSASDKSSALSLTWNLTPMEAAKLSFVLHFYGSGLTADRIRKCPLESCGNIFVLKSYAREDREHFCSIKCARNAATRRYRKKGKKKQKSRSRRKR